MKLFFIIIITAGEIKSSAAGATTYNSMGLVALPEKEPQVTTVQPKSGLNFVLYNSVFEVVEENTGYLPVDDNINSIQTLATDYMVMKEAEFIEIFVNNDSNTPVYYDNMMVTHRGGAGSNVLEVNAYRKQLKMFAQMCFCGEACRNAEQLNKAKSIF